MSDTAPVVRSLRPGEGINVTGPARVVVQSIPDGRVVLAIYPEPGTNVVREERSR